MRVWVQAVVLTVVGVVLIGGSIAFHLYFSTLFSSMLEKRLQLVPDSQTLERFKSPPVPIYMQFWLFNITNSEDVLQGSTPHLQEVGPFTYEEKQLKYNLSFNDQEGSVTYLQNKTFFYRPDLSPGVSLEDQVTTVNAVMISLGSRLASRPEAFSVIAQVWFDRFGTTPFVTKSVRQLLFEGYEEPLLLQLAGLTNDPEHASGKFGFYRRNNTHGGTYTINTGTKGMDTYQNILRWRGEDKLSFWKDIDGHDTCNMINGTTGNQFPLPVRRGNPIWLYVAELCRSIYAEYEKDVKHGALTLYRFVLPPRLLAKTEANKCFCIDDFTCRASMINVSPCRKGAPVVMSTPHFYQGDEQDLKMLEGLSPSAQHQTYIDVEPHTGVTFRAAKRIQVNFPLRQYADLPAFRSVPNVTVPVFWVNESAEVPIEKTYDLHRTLTLPFTLVSVGVGVLACLGAVLILVAVIKVCLAARGKQKTESGVKNRRPPTNAQRDQPLTEKLNKRDYT